MQVDLDFRIKGFKTAFALGDVTDIKEEKMGFYAQSHGQMCGQVSTACMRVWDHFHTLMYPGTIFSTAWHVAWSQCQDKSNSDKPAPSSAASCPEHCHAFTRC